MPCFEEAALAPHLVLVLVDVVVVDLLLLNGISNETSRLSRPATYLGRARADSDFGGCCEIARTARVRWTRCWASTDASPPFSKINGLETGWHKQKRLGFELGSEKQRRIPGRVEVEKELGFALVFGANLDQRLVIQSEIVHAAVRRHERTGLTHGIDSRFVPSSSLRYVSES